MHIPLWMATAIIELGLTREDFDAFFAGYRAPIIGRNGANKTRPVMGSGTPTWMSAKDLDPIWDEICASIPGSGCMMGDDMLMPVVGCDED